MSLPFQNNYLHRTAGKESACWVCGKFTTAVLTHRDIDWFYVCLNHIGDPAFCKPEHQHSKDGKQLQDKKPNEKEKEKPADEKTQEVQRSQDSDTTPQTYILDQKLFYLRENEYRKRLQVRNAKQLKERLPSVPGGTRSFQ